MAILSAKEFRQNEVNEKVLDIGEGKEILVKRPDIETLVFNRLLPTPLFDDVVKIIAEWKGKDAAEIVENMQANSEKLSAFIDKWITFAVVQPKVVLDQPGPDDDAVWVEDLRLETRMQIFAETFDGKAAARSIRRALLTAAMDFRPVERSEATGSDVPEVQPETQPDLIHY